MVDKHTQRRKYVNDNFANKTRGTSMSNKKKKILLKKLWREAKKKYK